MKNFHLFVRMRSYAIKTPRGKFFSRALFSLVSYHNIATLLDVGVYLNCFGENVKNNKGKFWPTVTERNPEIAVGDITNSFRQRWS